MNVKTIGAWSFFSLFILFGFFFLHTHAQQSPSTAAAPKPVAEVVWVKGKVEAINPDKVSRQLKRKDRLYEHEMLSSAAKSEGQIVFTDGGLLAVRENTQFKIDEYRYKKGDASQNKFVGELIKGGLRTITGAISKDQPGNYKVNTPAATIGVRGTAFSVVCSAEKTSPCDFKLSAGEISVSNEHGQLILNQGNPYAESSATKRPAILADAPDVFNSEPNLTPAKPSSTLISPPEVPSGSRGGNVGGGTVSSFCISMLAELIALL